MRSAIFFSSLVSFVAAAADSPLSLHIDLKGNSGIKATLTNLADQDYKLLIPGTILDQNLLEKSQVISSKDGEVTFEGINPVLDPESFTDDSFEILLSGDSLELEWDVAADHDLSSGGDYKILSSGHIAYAMDLNSTIVGGTLQYESNSIEAKINGEEASAQRQSIVEHMEKRASLGNDCSGSRRSAVLNALGRCRDLAVWAEKQARTGSAERMNLFFKSTDSATRNWVGDNFRRIAKECGSPVTGISTFYCGDKYGYCQNNYIAYMTGKEVMQCPLFYNIPGDNKQCRANTRSTTTIHEVSHIREILGTSDHGGCYGIECIKRLSRDQNLMHADSYSFFAQSASSGCI